MAASQPPSDPPSGRPPATSYAQGPPSDAALHAADLERQIRRLAWIAGIGIVIALAAAGVGIYLAIDARDNSVTKDDIVELREELGLGAGSGSATEQDPETQGEQLDGQADQAEQELDREADQAERELDREADQAERELEREADQAGGSSDKNADKQAEQFEKQLEEQLESGFE